MKNTLLLTVLIPVLVFGADRLTGRSFTTRSEVIAKNGMAASDHPFVSQAAIEILKQGGNAIDAAIAANAVQSVVEPGENGIGGDLFAMIWHAQSNKLYGINGSGRSSKSRSLAYLKDTLKLTRGPNIGGMAVTVPGCVAAWFDMHKRFGSLPMKKILSRAIHYAREGFPVTDQIGHKWRTRLAERKAIGQTALWELYTLNGKLPEKGEIFKNPALASTYKILAKKGRKAFYKSEIAESIVKAVQHAGGILTLDDLVAHRSDWIEPVSAQYRGYDVWALPPNGHGIAVLQILNLLEPYDINRMGFGSAEYIHCFVEAKKLVYEDRAKFYADIDVGKVPVKALISKAYADKRRKLINENEAAQNVAPGDPFSNNSETIYITVADKEGNMVSLIQSNASNMGSGVVPKGRGFVLHNRAYGFNLIEGHLNCYAPGKRPWHSIIPGFVTRKGKPYISFGVMYGDMQPQAQVQILVNIIDFGMNLQEAGDAPRVRHYGSTPPYVKRPMENGGEVWLESGFSAETINQLLRMGHEVKSHDGGFGGYQAIMRDHEKGVYFGASDPRKDGQAIGY